MSQHTQVAVLAARLMAKHRMTVAYGLMVLAGILATVGMMGMTDPLVRAQFPLCLTGQADPSVAPVFFGHCAACWGAVAAATSAMVLAWDRR